MLHTNLTESFYLLLFCRGKYWGGKNKTEQIKGFASALYSADELDTNRVASPGGMPGLWGQWQGSPWERKLFHPGVARLDNRSSAFSARPELHTACGHLRSVMCHWPPRPPGREHSSCFPFHLLHWRPAACWNKILWIVLDWTNQWMFTSWFRGEIRFYIWTQWVFGLLSKYIWLYKSVNEILFIWCDLFRHEGGNNIVPHCSTAWNRSAQFHYGRQPQTSPSGLVCRGGSDTVQCFCPRQVLT